MGFGIDRRARSRKKRGLFGGAPDAAEVGARLARLVGRVVGRSAVIDATAKRVTLRFAPFARPVRIVVAPSGELEVTGDTSALGPGYHAHVLAKLAPLLDELDYAWADADVAQLEVEAAHLAWLQDIVRRSDPEAQTSINMPGDRVFVVEGDAPILTPLGPRDRAWRDAVIADAAHGRDAFAWWERGGGRAERARALLAMWHDVAWRAPIADDEDELLARVHGWLLAARAADPAQALPWGAWRELCALDDRTVEPALRTQLDAHDFDRSFGYRRFDLETDLPVGWSLRMPGSFVGGWVDDDSRYVATDGARAIELVTLTASADLDSAALLTKSPEKFPVIARRAGTRAARAELAPDGTLHGLVADAPHVAILTCRGGYEEWALGIWESLARTTTA